MRSNKVYHKNDKLGQLLQKAADSKNRKEQDEALDLIAEATAYNFNVDAGYIKKDVDETDEAKALQVTPQAPIQEGIMDGDNHSMIFETSMLGYDENPSFPMDIVAPGTEGDYVAYSMPHTGYIPLRHVEGDEVTLNTYRIANAIDWDIKYSRSARIDVVSRALEVMRAGIVKKMNDDAWHTILAAGLDRGLMVYDSTATQGQFTKKLISLMKITMRRNGGGNSSSMNSFNLTDLFLSPEAMEDIRSWGTSIISDINRADVEYDPSGTVSRMFGINLHSMTELGEGQEYNNYFTGTLGGSLQASDVELCVGLDLSKRGVFLNPVRGQGLEVYNDESLRRSGYTGFFGSMELSWGILDSRSVLLASL